VDTMEQKKRGPLPAVATATSGRGNLLQR